MITTFDKPNSVGLKCFSGKCEHALDFLGLGSAKPLTTQQWAVGLAAGFLMGYSSRLAFGCNVGAMLSGISTGSLHGWIWVPLAFAGTLVGVRVRRRFGF